MQVQEDEDGHLLTNPDRSEERPLDVRGWAEPAACKHFMESVRVWYSAPDDMLLSVHPGTQHAALEPTVLTLQPAGVAAGAL